MTSCMSHQINTRTINSGGANVVIKTNMINIFSKLVLDITNECLLSSVDNFDACNKQTHQGLCYRAIIDSPFERVHKIICMCPLQHTCVGGGSLWCGEAN